MAQLLNGLLIRLLSRLLNRLLNGPGRTRRMVMTASVGIALAATSCSTPAPKPHASSGPESSPQSGPNPTGTSPGSPDALPSTSDAPPGGEQPLGWGPLRKDLEAARTAVAAMTPEQKAGQVLMPVYTGKDPAAQLAAIRDLHLAGSIVMGDNVPKAPDGGVDTAALAAVTRQLGEAARADGRPWKGLVGVDQEGGLVSRLGAPITEWPTPLSYGAAGKDSLAAEGGRSLAAELAGLGFTVDFAPNADVTIGAADPTIGSRSMAGNPDVAGRLAVSFGAGMLASGVLPAVKHFPGHGSVTVDSHKELPVQGASLEQLQARDWKPFRKAIDAGLPMIMMGHIAVPSLEPGVPASVSKANYDALRSLGFQGVIVTDALNMGAITTMYPGESAAARALAAGADLLLMPGNVRAAHAGILSALREGRLSGERLDEAAVRVVAMMFWHTRSRPVPAPVGGGAATSAAVSAAAVTVVKGPCTGRLIPSSVSLSGGSVLERERFTAAARRAGVAVGSGPIVSLAGYGSGAVTGDVAVALDTPSPLAGSTAPTKIALYGRTSAAFDALLAVLTGKAAAPGKLPAGVGRYPEGSGCA
jgi:beta-N-acetylhexosaminidase